MNEDSSGFDSFTLAGPAGKLAGWLTSQRYDPALTPVLFIHPINLQGACWFDVVRGIRPSRTCILPDLRGHGGSVANGPYGIDPWVDDCLAVLDQLKLDKVHVVGGSLGGTLAVALAARVPGRVVSIAAFGSALAIEGEDLEAVLDILQEKGVQGMFRAVLPEISVAPATDPRVIERILNITNPNEVSTVSEIWRATITSDVSHLASQVRCPALVVNGEFDKTCTPEQGATMARALSTDLVIMPGVGHLPMFENPAAVASLISQHFNASDKCSPC